MKIGIIGAGFTGLSAGYYLQKNNHKVTIFEKESKPGGLAAGFKKNAWDWYLDKYYHHIFLSDRSVRKLAGDIGIEVNFSRPKTKSLIEDEIFLLDSPLNLLKFSRLNIFERLRMGFVIVYLKYNPFWKSMEDISAIKWLNKYMGKKATKLIWEPLLSAKFGEEKNNISLTWFWARIKKRSTRLGYPKGGFQNFANKIREKIETYGGNINFDSEIKEIKKQDDIIKVIFLKGNKTHEEFFDKLIVTIPSSVFKKTVKDFPRNYIQTIKNLSSQSLILFLKKPFFYDDTYWLSICDKEFPFLAIVEHTNFINHIHFGNNHIVYISNYLSKNHSYFKKTKNELLNIFDPFLKKINNNYGENLVSIELFRDEFAQPVLPFSYSKLIPPLETPIKNIYLANMEQVYPWDRGVNYAIELGEKVARQVNEKD